MRIVVDQPAAVFLFCKQVIVLELGFLVPVALDGTPTLAAVKEVHHDKHPGRIWLVQYNLGDIFVNVLLDPVLVSHYLIHLEHQFLLVANFHQAALSLAEVGQFIAETLH